MHIGREIRRVTVTRRPQRERVIALPPGQHIGLRDVIVATETLTEQREVIAQLLTGAFRMRNDTAPAPILEQVVLAATPTRRAIA